MATNWIETVRRGIISTYDTTTAEGSRSAAADLRIRAFREERNSRRYWAVVELARAFDCLFLYHHTGDSQWKRQSCTHLDNALDWAREAA